MELAHHHCSCSHDDQACFSTRRSVLGRASSRVGPEDLWISRVFFYMVRWIASAISKALTVSFAIVGSFAGGITGALAGWVSGRGVLGGGALLAIAGASVSLEILDTLRSYWCPKCAGSSSMVDFLQNLLHGRFINEQFEQFPPATSQTYVLQLVNHSNRSYEETNIVSGEVTSAGLSADSLKRLPSYVLLDEIRAAQGACCTICLQDIGVGDTARSLPQCHHTFHLTCVDRWLIRHGSCPVCRQDV